MKQGNLSLFKEVVIEQEIYLYNYPMAAKQRQDINMYIIRVVKSDTTIITTSRTIKSSFSFLQIYKKHTYYTSNAYLLMCQTYVPSVLKNV